MKLAAKIVCRTLGTVGMGVALYDAVNVANQFSKNGAQKEQAKYLEKAYFDSRTIDTVSYSNKIIQDKVFDYRTRNPLPALWGRLKGGVEGTLYSLGNSLFLVGSSALALTAKNVFAKIGATGVALTACYNVLRSGYGMGKKHPMD